MRLIRIPKERVGALIGEKGETKALVQKRTGVKLIISSEGEVDIEENPEDPVASLKVMDFVKAVGRGFSPQRAMRLLEEDEYLEVIEIADYIGSKKPEQTIRVRARLIGSQGKTRKIIEDLTGVNMSIFGSTVCLIGNSTVYRYLERSRPMLRIAEMGFD